MLLVNVAIFDFLMSFLGAPFPMIAAFLREWPFGDRVCILYGFGMSFGGESITQSWNSNLNGHSMEIMLSCFQGLEA